MITRICDPLSVPTNYDGLLKHLTLQVSRFKKIDRLVSNYE